MTENNEASLAHVRLFILESKTIDEFLNKVKKTPLLRTSGVLFKFFYEITKYSEGLRVQKLCLQMAQTKR